MKSNQSKAKKIYNAVSTVIVALIFVFMIVVVAVMLVQKNNGGETELFGYRMYDADRQYERNDRTGRRDYVQER